eukprot:3893036-Amphidinium_carterae.1
MSPNRHDQSLSRAPATPPNAHDGSQLSATTAGVRENRDQLLEQLIAENVALRASPDQQALQPNLFPWLMLVELISVAAEAEI